MPTGTQSPTVVGTTQSRTPSLCDTKSGTRWKGGDMGERVRQREGIRPSERAKRPTRTSFIVNNTLESV
jgi:hypothetical protein